MLLTTDPTFLAGELIVNIRQPDFRKISQTPGDTWRPRLMHWAGLSDVFPPYLEDKMTRMTPQESLDTKS